MNLKILLCKQSLQMQLCDRTRVIVASDVSDQYIINNYCYMIGFADDKAAQRRHFRPNPHQTRRSPYRCIGATNLASSRPCQKTANFTDMIASNNKLIIRPPRTHVKFGHFECKELELSYQNQKQQDIHDTPQPLQPHLITDDGLE